MDAETLRELIYLKIDPYERHHNPLHCVTLAIRNNRENALYYLLSNNNLSGAYSTYTIFIEASNKNNMNIINTLVAEYKEKAIRLQKQYIDYDCLFTLSYTHRMTPTQEPVLNRPSILGNAIIKKYREQIMLYLKNGANIWKVAKQVNFKHTDMQFAIDFHYSLNRKKIDILLPDFPDELCDLISKFF